AFLIFLLFCHFQFSFSRFRGVRFVSCPISRRLMANNIRRTANHVSYLSSVAPHFLQTLTLRSPCTAWPILTGPQVEQTSWTFEIETGLSCSAIPPFDFWVGRMCFFTIMTCSTRSVPLSGNTRSTRPCLPLSLPLNTFTVSLRRMSNRLCAVAIAINSLSTELPAPNSRFSKTFSRAAHAQLVRTRAYLPARQPR